MYTCSIELLRLSLSIDFSKEDLWESEAVSIADYP